MLRKPLKLEKLQQNSLNFEILIVGKTVLIKNKNLAGKSVELEGNCGKTPRI